jgi:hypothetical protein
MKLIDNQYLAIRVKSCDPNERGRTFRGQRERADVNGRVCGTLPSDEAGTERRSDSQSGFGEHVLVDSKT